jgi:hypothetical protein
MKYPPVIRYLGDPISGAKWVTFAKEQLKNAEKLGLYHVLKPLPDGGFIKIIVNKNTSSIITISAAGGLFICWQNRNQSSPDYGKWLKFTGVTEYIDPDTNDIYYLEKTSTLKDGVFANATQHWHGVSKEVSYASGFVTDRIRYSNGMSVIAQGMLTSDTAIAMLRSGSIFRMAVISLFNDDTSSTSSLLQQVDIITSNTATFVYAAFDRKLEYLVFVYTYQDSTDSQIKHQRFSRYNFGFDVDENGDKWLWVGDEIILHEFQITEAYTLSNNSIQYRSTHYTQGYFELDKNGVLSCVSEVDSYTESGGELITPAYYINTKVSAYTRSAYTTLIRNGVDMGPQQSHLQDTSVYTEVFNSKFNTTTVSGRKLEIINARGESNFTHYRIGNRVQKGSAEGFPHNDALIMNLDTMEITFYPYCEINVNTWTRYTFSGQLYSSHFNAYFYGYTTWKLNESILMLYYYNAYDMPFHYLDDDGSTNYLVNENYVNEEWYGNTKTVVTVTESRKDFPAVYSAISLKRNVESVNILKIDTNNGDVSETPLVTKNIQKILCPIYYCDAVLAVGPSGSQSTYETAIVGTNEFQTVFQPPDDGSQTVIDDKWTPPTVTNVNGFGSSYASLDKYSLTTDFGIYKASSGANFIGYNTYHIKKNSDGTCSVKVLSDTTQVGQGFGISS